MKLLALGTLAALGYFFWKGGANTGDVTGSISAGWTATMSAMPFTLGATTAPPAAPCGCSDAATKAAVAQSSMAGGGCGCGGGAYPANTATLDAPIVFGGN